MLPPDVTFISVIGLLGLGALFYLVRYKLEGQRLKARAYAEEKEPRGNFVTEKEYQRYLRYRLARVKEKLSWYVDPSSTTSILEYNLRDAQKALRHEEERVAAVRGSEVYPRTGESGPARRYR